MRPAPTPTAPLPNGATGPVIGNLQLANRLILAPMAGITDRPLRVLCRRFGAALAVSEMVSTDPSLRGSRKSRERLDHRGEPGPIAVQLLGADPVQMAESARYHVDQGAQIIDINLGCPARKVCRVAAGSALLRDEPLVGRMLEAVVRAVPVPVTLKTRTGWSPETRNLLRIAALAEAAGIALITVHGRTRACGFAGLAEFDSLRALRRQTRLPLVANGDIATAAQARAVLDYTGADAIMLGRAALGRPWLFREIDHFLATGDDLPAPDPAQDPAQDPAWIGGVVLEHLDALYGLYGEVRGSQIARKHIAWYCGGWAVSDAGSSSDEGAHKGVDRGADRVAGGNTANFLAELMRADSARRQMAMVRSHFLGPAPPGGSRTKAQPASRPAVATRPQPGPRADVP